MAAVRLAQHFGNTLSKKALLANPVSFKKLYLMQNLLLIKQFNYL
jgi:hypothetical protein